ANLVRHIKNTKAYGVNVVVAVNRFSTDMDDEIRAVRAAALAAGAYDAVVCTHHAHGGKGAVGERVIEGLEMIEVTNEKSLLPRLRGYKYHPLHVNSYPLNQIR
nr:formate--tetrahydrofolate ligase [Tanacetum cinerariifolium]